MTRAAKTTKAKNAVEKVKKLVEALEAFKNGHADSDAEAVLEALAEASE